MKSETPFYALSDDPCAPTDALPGVVLDWTAAWIAIDYHTLSYEDCLLIRLCCFPHFYVLMHLNFINGI